jgi:hypothetical protein
MTNGGVAALRRFKIDRSALSLDSEALEGRLSTVRIP